MKQWTPAEYEAGEPQGPLPLSQQIIGIDELKELAPPDPLIDGLVFQREMCQLTGSPGSGKSFVALGWACAVASGQTSWEGHRIHKSGPVVYVAAEGASGLWLRIAAWCQMNNVDPETLAGRLFVLPAAAQLGKETDVAEVVLAVQERSAILCVFDTRARMTVGLDENSSQDQGIAIRYVDTIIRECACAVVVVHHSARSGTGAGRGSSAWDGAIFSDLRLSGEKGTSLIQLECAKHKDAPDGCKHDYVLKPITVAPSTLPGRNERERSTLVVISSDGNEHSDASRNERVVLEIIQSTATGSGLRKTEIRDMAIAEGVSRPSVYRIIKQLSDKGTILNVGTDKLERYVAAVGTFDV